MDATTPKIMVEDKWRGRIFSGEWRRASGGAMDVLEPATSAALTNVGQAGPADIREAASRAKAAQPGWAATPYEKRAAILREAAHLIEDNQGELIPGSRAKPYDFTMRRQCSHAA